MWKRDESVKPAPPAAVPAAPAAPAASAPQASGESRTHTFQAQGANVNIGKSVVIKGELSGSEDLTIEGHVEGRIELKENVLTIGPNARIKAEVFAKTVIVQGEVAGNVTATEKVDIRDNGSVDGDITSPRVAIAEGAHFRGSVDMQRTTAKPAAPAKPAVPSSTSTATPAPAQTPAAAAAQPAGAVHGQKVGA
jgi:cytoskeletal protein CcmA (bactofilin family)